MSAIFDENLIFHQENGPDFELVVNGDEFYARYESIDGYTRKVMDIIAAPLKVDPIVLYAYRDAFKIILTNLNRSSARLLAHQSRSRRHPPNSSPTGP